MSNIITVDSAKHQVRTVCVFQADRAEVQRIIPVQLKEGQNGVVIENLPNVIDKDSIRVEGLGNAVIFDVVYSPPPPFDYYKSQTKQDEALRSLTKHIEEMESEKSILQDQGRVLDDYSKTLTAEKADASKVDDFLNTYQSRRRRIQKELSEVKDALDAVQKERDEKMTALSEDDQSQKRKVKITVVVLAQAAGEAELSISYVVSGASWSPLYDLRATISTTPKEPSKIQLQYRASIMQSTGEDWNDVDLTLSTASPQLGTEIPTLSPYKIGPEWIRPPVQLRSGRGTMRARKSVVPEMAEESQAVMYSMEESGAPMAMMASMPPPPAPVAHATASAVEGATSSTFAIAGRSSIPSEDASGQQTHKVSIAMIDLDAQLEWISVPKVQASTFLRCQVKNTSQYILLPGASSVFMDNNFVCKSSLPTVSPQESFSTSLGVDPAIRITYHNLQKRHKSSAGGFMAAKSDITVFTQRITIKNTRSTSVSPLFIKDQVPVSEDNDFKVNVLEPRELGPAKERREVPITGEVEARWAFHEGDEAGTGRGVEEDGAVEWVCDLDAGKSADIALTYEVSGPAGKKWERRY